MPLPPRYWMRVTWLGWLLGVPAVALLALFGEALGMGGAQGWVGAGMGLAVGLLQGRAVRRVGIGAGAWLLATSLGLAAPFLAVDLLRALGREAPYYLLLCVACGGLGVGLLQARLVGRVSDQGGRWVVASLGGWLLAAGAVAAADRMFRAHRVAGLAGALLYLGLIAVGGLVLGLLTAPIAARLPAPVAGR